MKSQSGLFSNLESNRVVSFLTGAVAIFFILMVVNFYWVAERSERSRLYSQIASELRVLSQRIAKNATEAAAGNGKAFALLHRSKSEFAESWGSILNGDSALNLEGNPEIATAEMQALKVVWARVSASADIILQGEGTVLDLHSVARTLNETIPQLQTDYNDVVEILLESNASAYQISKAQEQAWVAERIARSVSNVLGGGEEAVMAADNFGRDAARFGRVLKAMIEGDASLNIKPVKSGEALEYLADIAETFEIVNENVDQILETSPELFQVRGEADNIFQDSQELLQEATNLARRFGDITEEGLASNVFGAIFALLAVGFSILTGVTLIRDARRHHEIAEQENDRNQTAILRLLDELSNLADGDLTVEATVTEDFTGAIADSINFAIDQMRVLVSSINETAVQVSSAAQETQATAMHLAEASEHQAQEIAGASAAINEMAVSIDQVSANASESAAVAERSVGIANKGAEVVQNTIHGMDTIREQIQETSKRIKRLGESSQEIGDIVSLITDIADQTNILALNAAIQASMAGDAGRGFAVVADEVQRLAERASSATKQIEALVKTIQTDTNEAVISMEDTTSEVVSGARLAQDAGVSLEEIENVSKNLADLIQNISNAARQQAASAGHISNTMNVIQEITSQTSAGTTATATSIGNLAEQAGEMRSSVAGFKLPENA
ncbi:MAG: chemotaxis protein [Gammaproteobacteria bacterium]|nr:MAG: chemotaxis protein [Gammaproteobacteria bacterium]